MSKLLSTTAVAKLLHVSVGSVAKWIDKGQLKAGRTPGGHRRVAAKDVVAFLKRQGLPIPPELQKNAAPKILIVDDETDVVSWLTAEIRDAHPEYEVLQAYDGFSAGEIFGAERPGVVLLDIRLPGLDGFEVCRRIKARASDNGQTTVLAMTADCNEQVAAEIVACGAMACLSKPLDPADLIARIEAAVR
ncbi:MAG: response regulator [Phycisphaerae bacterium]|nr:response regulator [Phycisphaerae bacterium]